MRLTLILIALGLAVWSAMLWAIYTAAHIGARIAEVTQ